MDKRLVLVREDLEYLQSRLERFENDLKSYPRHLGENFDLCMSYYDVLNGSLSRIRRRYYISQLDDDGIDEMIFDLDCRLRAISSSLWR